MIHVKVDNLVKIYGEGGSLVHALNDISFTINKKEFVVFMGPSGAGKSTLIYMMAGLDTPTKGKITIGESDIVKLSDSERCDLRRYEIGIVFQFFNLHPGLTVA
ncbi:MAG: ATP-binding cassette domain-containing protein, partial [Candidatus Hodarchaeales archaeon]